MCIIKNFSQLTCIIISAASVVDIEVAQDLSSECRHVQADRRILSETDLKALNVAPTMVATFPSDTFPLDTFLLDEVYRSHSRDHSL